MRHFDRAGVAERARVGTLRLLEETLDHPALRGFSKAQEVAPPARYAEEAARRISSALPAAGSVVLTGGTTAERIYPELAPQRNDWSGIEVFFSDERCVPPHDPASNFGMAMRLLLDRIAVGRVNRMRGEDDPREAADDYGRAIAPVAQRGIDLLLLGMGADCHVAALFPGSSALPESERLCSAVERPDGLRGLTLTPPALLAATTVLLLVAGKAKADAVRRALRGMESSHLCPVRILSQHRNATFVLDEAAASAI
jgi:6-phosphogluconolactonase